MPPWVGSRSAARVQIAAAERRCDRRARAAQDAGEGHHEAAAGGAAAFFRELTVGGVARPVDTLLMACLILYCARPFGRVATSSSRQLAYVFRARPPRAAAPFL